MEIIFVFQVYPRVSRKLLFINDASVKSHLPSLARYFILTSYIFSCNWSCSLEYTNKIHSRFYVIDSTSVSLCSFRSRWHVISPDINIASDINIALEVNSFFNYVQADCHVAGGR